MNDELSIEPVGTTAEPVKVEAARGVNWKQVGAFLGVTFALSWLLDLALFLRGGLTHPAALLVLQLQMLLPAFSALLLGVFFFENSPVFFKTNRTTSRWFIYYFFLLTVVQAGGALYALFQPMAYAPMAVQNLTQPLLLVSFAGLVLLVVLRLAGGKNAFAAAGMAGGKWWMWITFGLALVAFYALQAALNLLTGLGKPVNLLEAIPSLASANMPLPALYGVLALNTILIGPILGLIIAFGEEYGWRGYLQPELIRLGRLRGVLLLGVIWGVWHWPVIWMGYDYPGEPVWGSLLIVCDTIILAIFLAYAVFKSKGVWTAAYLHALNNQTLDFFVLTMVAPTSVLFSFGIGLAGIAIGALLCFVILRDPVWRQPVDLTLSQVQHQVD